MGIIVNVENYSFTYSSAKKAALNNIDLKLHEKEITILAGPTGCGKSTLLKSFIGLIPHMYAGSLSGRVIIDGIVVHDAQISDLATKVGYVFQNPENQIFMFSVERDIAFGLENLGIDRSSIRERIDWAMSLLDIQSLAMKPPHEISDGQKQRTALAGVLAMRPKILILDEPTSLLDPKTALDLINLVENLRETLGMTIIIVEHRLDLVSRIADRILIMDKGEIVSDGAPRDIFMSDHPSLLQVGMPTVIRMYKALSSRGIDIDGPPTSVDYMIEAIKRWKK